MGIAEQMVDAALPFFPGCLADVAFLHYEATTELAKFARSV